MSQMQDFLETFLAHKPSDHYYYLWTLNDKQSHCYQSFWGVVEDATDWMKQTDVYIGMALSHDLLEIDQRVTKKTASGIMGAWADIDIETPGHHKGNDRYPATIDDALTLIEELPQPTMIVQSGGGLHVYWLFKEPWIFTDDAERAQAETFLLKWQEAIRRKARPRGWKIDSTADTPRVLRVAGTLNHKTQPPSLVTLSSCQPDQRYAPEYLMQLVKDVTLEKTRAAKTHAPKLFTEDGEPASSTTFTLSGKANPPLEKWKAAMRNKKFKLTWDRKRADFPDNDYSPSAYCISLADQLVRLGWDDQEIVDALIAWRREQMEDLKLDRRDWYDMILHDAHEYMALTSAPPQPESESSLHDDEDGPDDAPPADDPPPVDETELREKRLLLLYGKLGVKILKIEKYMTDPPHFRLITQKAAIDLGEVGNLIEQIQFRKKVAAASGRYMSGFDKPEWARIAQLLLDVCVEIEVSEGTISGMMREALRDYLRDRKPSQKWDVMVTNQHPYIFDDHVVIELDDFLSYYNSKHLSEQETRRSLAIKLKVIGAYSNIVNRRMSNDARAPKRVWHLPADILQAEVADDDEAGDKVG